VGKTKKRKSLLRSKREGKGKTALRKGMDRGIKCVAPGNEEYILKNTGAKGKTKDVKKLVCSWEGNPGYPRRMVSKQGLTNGTTGTIQT